MAFLMGCENVSLEYPVKRIFNKLTLGLEDGDRVGVVGSNGDGKSSLLQLLAQVKEADSGRIIARSGLRVGYLEQIDRLDPEATVGYAVVGDAAEHEWAADPRMRGIINGIIGDLPWGALVGQLSGGQRRRVDLARVLLGDHDVLLLDEPTNHLDMHAIAWLAAHLQQRWNKKDGALVVVTHDRWFLDEVCTRMLEVHDGIAEPFEGGFSAYVLQKVERERQTELAWQKHNNLMRRELAWLTRGARARATKPKFHMESAKALIAAEPPIRNSIELKRSAMSRLGKQVIDLKNVSVRYGDNRVIDDVTWLIGAGDRFGILGENGAGKTTLLKLIMGRKRPNAGFVKIGKTVKFAYLSQELEGLRELEDDRVHEILGRFKTRYEIEGKELTPAQLLERLGFENAHLQSRVRDLSGGQRRRLMLMLILLDRPNVLILDEPGNDLDTQMLAAMENLLDTWPGTLILVSHDRYLMERVTDDQFALINGKLRHCPGGVDEYLKLLEDKPSPAGNAAQGSNAKGGKGTGSVSDAGQKGKTSGVSDAALAHQMRKELYSIERKITTLERKVNATIAKMHETDPMDYMALGALQVEQRGYETQISELEEQWLEISEKLS